MEALFLLKFVLLFVLIASALLVHFRGRVRHTFRRQLTDHSTFMAPYNALIYFFSAVPPDPILDVNQFPELSPLRDHWRIIAEEAKKRYEAGSIGPADKHNDVAFNSFFKRGWKRFYLKWYDDVLPSAASLCPNTVKLVQSIPSIHAALFALLPPGSRLGEHRDPFAGSLRYHLGLITPNSDACGIHVDGEAYSWRDGKDVIFDETYIHRANNDTDDIRIILFCDVERPLRNPFMRRVNRFVIRHIAKVSAAHNRETEKIGALNRISAHIHRLGEFFQRLKKVNRRLYYLGKYTLLLLLFYRFFF